MRHLPPVSWLVGSLVILSVKQGSATPVGPSTNWHFGGMPHFDVTGVEQGHLNLLGSAIERWIQGAEGRRCYSGRSESARRGTTNDTRKIGKNLFPVHLKATTWPSAASKVRVRLKFRPLRTCRE